MEAGAGLAAAVTDADYEAAGAKLVAERRPRRSPAPTSC